MDLTPLNKMPVIKSIISDLLAEVESLKSEIKRLDDSKAERKGPKQKGTKQWK